MLRGILFFLKLAIVVGIGVWLAERPGDVSIVWQGYRLDTTFGMLLLGALVIAVAAVLLSKIWRRVRHAPEDVGRLFRGRRESRGYQALTQGMVAVAAGEPEEARRYAKKADHLLKNPPLTHLLSAQAAQLNGEDADARSHYRAMLDDPETRFLGLRGLYRQAEREGDLQEALVHVRDARAIRPETSWVLTALFDLSLKTGDIDTALDAVTDMQRHRRLTKDEAKRRRGVLLTEKAKRAHAAGNKEAARDASKRAFELTPDLPPTALIRAEVHLADDERRRAAKTLEKTWATSPHPDLVNPYLRARKADTPVDRYRQLHKLTDRNVGHRESELALGRIALEADFWGEARKHLTKAGGEHPDETVCRLMAQLEEREKGDSEAARAWLVKAADAVPGPEWICNACGAVAASWHAQCSHCDAFDSFAWRAPVRVVDELGEPATHAQLEPAAESEETTAAESAAETLNVPDAEVEKSTETQTGGTAKATDRSA